MLVMYQRSQKDGKNMSLSKRILLLGGILLTATFLLVLSAISPVYAATTVKATTVVNRPPCNYTKAQKIYDVSQTHGGEIRHIQLWYSAGSRCVWAVETNGQPNDTVWVWNVDTNAQSSVTSTGHTTTTNEIHDHGTHSHACMWPHYTDGTIAPHKTCTPYY